MSDVDKYIARRKQTDAEFTEDFESGYSSFKIGVLLAQAKIEAGITQAQEELARRLNLHESIIIRIENDGSEDV
jgi:DNA-binding XRE family transcriptional regulator